MSVYVFAPDNTVAKYPYSLTDLIFDNPETSFPNQMTDEIAAKFNTYPVVETPQPSYNPISENLVWADPISENGVWVQQWAVTQATPEEIAQRETQAKESNKSRAKSELAETDWTDIPAVSDPANNPHLVNRDEFNTYRLQLRSIAVNPPVTVDPWPVKPNEVWSS